MYSDEEIEEIQKGNENQGRFYARIHVLIDELLTERDHLRKTIVRQEQALARAHNEIRELRDAGKLQ